MAEQASKAITPEAARLHSLPIQDEQAIPAATGREFRRGLDSMIDQLSNALDFHRLMDTFIGNVRKNVPCDGIEYEEESLNLYLLDGDLAPCVCHYHLSYQSRTLGCIRFTRSHAFSDDEISILETMLSGLVLPLHNALRYQQAVQVAQRDELTGLRNSSYYHDNVNLEIERARRYQMPFSLVLIDIDDFRQINRQYSREVADHVLKQLARCVENLARSSDIVFRNGGDEFLVFLPNTTRDAARQMAERIKRHIDDKTFEVQQQTVELTVSAGVVTVSDDDNAYKLFSRVDKALFHAKILGKNRVYTEAAAESLQRGWS